MIIEAQGVAQKRALVERDVPPGPEAPVLPGWGAWGGHAAVESERVRRRRERW